MKDISATIMEQNPVAPGTFLLDLQVEDFGPWRPGQFVMLRVGPSDDPFLRRPLAVMGCARGLLRLLYQVRGRGTAMLSHLPVGAVLSVLGPLGHGFDDPPDGREAVLVAGGTGLPPLVALFGRLKQSHLIIGVKSADCIPQLGELNASSVVYATEDGSRGFHGLATEALEERLARFPDCGTIYACGPLPMLKRIAAIAFERGSACQVCLEERMGCGFGVCSGCVVPTRDGNRRVCREGPAFNASDILWKEL